MSEPHQPEDEIEASRAPLLDHLVELRQRLVRSLIAVVLAFIVCFAFADDIYRLLLRPYEAAAGLLAAQKAAQAVAQTSAVKTGFFDGILQALHQVAFTSLLSYSPVRDQARLRSAGGEGNGDFSVPPRRNHR